MSGTASSDPSARPRVLFVHAADELYGSDVILLTIARALGERGIAAHVVLPNDLPYEGRLTAALRDVGVPVRSMRLGVLRRRYYTPLGMLRFAAALLVSSARLAWIIRRERIDVVHSHTAAVFSGALAARLTGRPHLWHVSEIVERPRAVNRALALVVPALSDRVVAVSQAVVDAMRSRRPAHQARWSVVYNGIDATRFAAPAPEARAAVRREAGFADGDVVVAMIGRVGTWKGQELLVDAFVDVARAEPRARLLLVGGGVGAGDAALQALRAHVSRAGLERETVIWGYRADVPELLAAIDVFVQPSLNPDPLPTTVLEAMAASRPVVATAHGGSVEMVVDGVTGLLSAPGDARALGARILELVRDEPLRRRLGAAGAARVRDEFSVPAFVARYVAIYEELAAGRLTRRRGT